MTEPDDLGWLQALGLTSWAPEAREHFIRITPVMLNGRYLTASDRPHAA